MIGSSSYVTSIKKSRAMLGGCVCSPSPSSSTPIGGPFLPLAGGNMDPSPAGVIGAHTVSGLTTLESDNAGNDLSILTQPGGSDINIDTTLSGGDFNVNSTATEITSTNAVDINCIDVAVNGRLKVEPLSVPMPVPPSGASEVGIYVNNWSNTIGINRYIGVDIDNIGNDASTLEGIGCLATNIKGNGGFGFRAANITNYGYDASAGYDAISIVSGPTATSAVSAYQASTINALAGQSGTNGTRATGVNITDVKGENVVGIRLVDLQSISPIPGCSASGLLVDTINTTFGDSFGAQITAINTLSGNSTGCVIDNINATDGNAKGMTIGKISSTGVNIAASGIDITDITSTVGQGQGIGINTVTGDNCIGLNVDNVTANQKAIGYNIQNITANLQDCHGFKAFRMISDASNCYGAKIDRVVANTGVAYGISVDDVNGTARTYGIYLGPNMSVGPGGTILGFFQEGNPLIKVINNFDGELRCGTQEDPNTGLSLTIKGNAFYTAQIINGPGAIVENGGNLIILKNVGSYYVVSLPFTNVQEGHQYTICMTNTDSVSLLGGGIPVNGGASYTLNGITTPDYKMYQAFYTNASGSGEWYIG